MGWSIRLGTVGGTAVRLHLTFLLLLVWIWIMHYRIDGTAAAWQRMQHAAASDGIELQVVSAWRSVDYQCGIVERKLARGQRIDQILAVSAAPGYSEHHSGRALDLTTPGFEPLEEEFENSLAFAWLCRNAAHFRFALSYPRDNPHGIAYEPWHWCWHRNGSGE